jgi:serine/threonine protein kinase
MLTALPSSSKPGARPAAEQHSETLPASSAVGVKVQDFSPGSRIANKYLVEGVIGEGGLGVVVKARHVQLEQAVAIKYLKPYALSLPGIVERFVREARLAARIKTSTRSRTASPTW